MDLQELAERVRRSIETDPTRLGLAGANLVVEPLLNWGGFVNRSFRVSDGEVTRHVKLSSDPEDQRALARLWELGSALEPYRAPRIVSTLQVPPDFEGLVSVWVEGGNPARLASIWIDEVCECVAALHRDDALRERLVSLGESLTSCAEVYRRTYHERFTADLGSIAQQPPPFLTPATLDWMNDEARLLEASVGAAAAFDQPADRPTHGDLWLDNLLVTPTGGWVLLDWDGLSIGDPVQDWAMLFGPSRSDLRPASEKVDPRELGLEADQLARWPMYVRASLLDWIIDPLADWVEAAREQHGSRIREVNESVHQRALALYRDLWDS